MRLFEAEGLIRTVRAETELSFERWNSYQVAKIELSVHTHTKTEIENWMAVEDAVRKAQGRLRLTIETVDPPKLRPLFFEIEALLAEVKEMDLEVVEPALIQHDLLRRLESLLRAYEQEMDYR